MILPFFISSNKTNYYEETGNNSIPFTVYLFMLNIKYCQKRRF